MASDIRTQIAGLQTYPNPFAGSTGALKTANNVVVNATNVAEPRRGFEISSYGFGSSSDRANAMAYYGTTLLVQYGTALARDTGAAFSDYSGTFTPVDNTKARMRFIGAASNLYFNCQDGTRELTSAAGTPAQAGVPKGLRTYAYNASNNGWQTSGTAVAYRSVWGIVDANGNEQVGFPTGRYVLYNSITSAVGGITRAAPDGSHPAGKVSVNSGLDIPHFLNPGDTVTLTPGEANFAAGLKTVVTVPTPWSFTYDEAGVTPATSTLAQTFTKTRSATVQVYTPSGITTSHFFRLYRSVMTADLTSEPDDEMYLVYEGKPTAPDIAAGYVAVNDVCPESFLGDPAPWNAQDGYGLVNANERPPTGLDMEYWDSRLWWGNTTSKHRFNGEMLGIGSPNGVQNNDTITIAGQTYTFKTTPGVPVTEVQIYTLNSSAATNIERTTMALVNAINANGSNTTVYAYYASGIGDATRGKFLVEERTIGGSAFTVSASRAASWAPALSRSSDNNARPHGLMYSKPGEPWAVPVVNEVLVGSENDEIKRIKALKGSLIVFKADGIYTVTGTNGRYSSERISTAKLLAPETVVVFADKVWGLTDQGLTSVSEGAGVSVISYAIEGDITALFGSTLANVKRYSFAVGYESDRRLITWIPASGDTTPTQSWNYSTSTRTFTRWTKHATCGLVNPSTDKLVIADGASNKVLTERKAFTFVDYADESFSATITSISGNVVTMNTSGHGIVAGDVLNSVGFGVGEPRDEQICVVTAVNGADVTVSQDVPNLPSSGAITVYKGIACSVRWHPVTVGNPALTKLHRQLTFLFNGADATLAQATFASELDATEDPVSLDFGTLPVINLTADIGAASSYRVCRIAPLPKDHAQCAQLTVGFDCREAFQRWKLHGWVCDLEADSERTGRR